MEASLIYCVGRNYANHAKELGNKVPEKPIIFFKPPASIVKSNEKVFLPKFSHNVQFEVELALKLGKNFDITDVAVANDLTARDQQKIAQETKTPWALAKGFKQSCGLGNWVKAPTNIGVLELRLTHNNKLAQKGFTKDMIFSPQSIIDYLRENFPLDVGDIVLTGTPEGVGTLKPGDHILAELYVTGSPTPISQGSWHFE